MKHVEIKHSEQYGPLVKANRFVRQRVEPADEFTSHYVEELLQELGFDPSAKRPTSKEKLVRCMSDFLECICWFDVNPNFEKLIVWAGSASAYTGGPYSLNVANKVKNALTAHGYLFEGQPPSKRDGLARLYTFDPALVHPDLKFKYHYNALVEVRAKGKRKGQNKIRGERMSLAKFRPEVDPIEADMRKINKMMVEHPLTYYDGVKNFDFCRRIFNNGCLTSGGRIYGDWQFENEDGRLASTIDGEQVCEIDLKASFLGIANFVFGDGQPLPFDAYSNLSFISEVREGREMAKKLIVRYVGSRGKSAQFPKGKKDKTTGEFVSFKENHNIPKNRNYKFYMDQVLEAYPFLRDVQNPKIDLMFIESEIVKTAILDLVDLGIPSFPVHDCLIVKLCDKLRAIQALQDSMRQHLGGCIHIDVSYLDESNNIQKEAIKAPIGACGVSIYKPKRFNTSWDIDDSDCEVIDLEEELASIESYLM